MTITRMQEPRQLYGLGSLVKKITKPIKKVVKSVGKVAKSPIGLAALGLGGAGLLGMGPFSGLANTKLGTTLFGMVGPGSGAARQGGLLSGLFNKFSNLSTGTKLGIGGGLISALAASGMSEAEIEETKRDPEKLKIYLRDYFSKLNPNASDEEVEQFVETNVSEYATGGRVGLMSGAMPTGIMRTNQAGTIERDYRETGGFVPVGIKEKADDVPAMLSKNEFVMTADAVRGMGDGSIEKGAQKLYDQMKRLENKVA